jgi:hypothetical protein
VANIQAFGVMLSGMRRLRIPKDADDRLLGVALYLSGDDLDKLGIDAAHETIEYGIENGELRINGKPES